MQRREFLKMSSMAAGAALTGCATGRNVAGYTVPADELVRGALIHLGSNMWTDVWTSAKPREPNWDDKVRVDYLRAEDDVWHEVTAAMAKARMNMVVIDLGEALEYPSHPELAVKGTWSVAKMRRELDRLRALGLEPVPKLNFSTTHNAWMKEWRHRVSSPEYMRTVRELIRDVAETFGGPRLFHIGFDEETTGHQRNDCYQCVVVRRRELWWRDFLETVQDVRDAGARAWCFSDQFWREPDLFRKLMPKDVVQCPWNANVDKDHPEWMTSIEEMGAMGFDVIADCATYPAKSVNPSPDGKGLVYTPIDRSRTDTSVVRMMAKCKACFRPENLRGFIVCPWMVTHGGVAREVLLDSIDYAGGKFLDFGRNGSGGAA